MSISKEEARVMVLCTLMLAIGVCISLVVLRCHDDKDELPETDKKLSQPFNTNGTPIPHTAEGAMK